LIDLQEVVNVTRTRQIKKQNLSKRFMVFILSFQSKYFLPVRQTDAKKLTSHALNTDFTFFQMCP